MLLVYQLVKNSPRFKELEGPLSCSQRSTTCTYPEPDISRPRLHPSKVKRSKILCATYTAVFMCFVWISEQTAIISLNSINWLVFITETKCVYCVVRARTLNKLKVFKVLITHCTNVKGCSYFIKSRLALRFLNDTVSTTQVTLRRIRFQNYHEWYIRWLRLRWRLRKTGTLARIRNYIFPILCQI